MTLRELIQSVDSEQYSESPLYMLVRPEYHHQGIGHKLLELMKEHYQDYLRIGLIAYNTELDFYESCGFKKAENASPMFITSLWT